MGVRNVEVLKMFNEILVENVVERVMGLWGGIIFKVF